MERKKSSGVLNSLFIPIVDGCSPSVNVQLYNVSQRAWYGMIWHGVNMCGNHIAWNLFVAGRSTGTLCKRSISCPFMQIMGRTEDLLHHPMDRIAMNEASMDLWGVTTLFNVQWRTGWPLLVSQRSEDVACRKDIKISYLYESKNGNEQGWTRKRRMR